MGTSPQRKQWRNRKQRITNQSRCEDDMKSLRQKQPQTGTACAIFQFNGTSRQQILTCWSEEVSNRQDKRELQQTCWCVHMLEMKILFSHEKNKTSPKRKTGNLNKKLKKKEADYICEICAELTEVPREETLLLNHFYVFCYKMRPFSVSK